MKNIFLVLVILCTFAGSLAQAHPTLPAKEAFTRTAPFNPDGRFTVSNISGSVEIRTWGKNEIRIDGEKCALTAEDLKLIGVALEMSATQATVKISRPPLPQSANAEAHLVITLPFTAVIERVSLEGKTFSSPGKVNPDSSVKIESIDGRVRTAVHGTLVREGPPKGFGWLKKLF